MTRTAQSLRLAEIRAEVADQPRRTRKKTFRQKPKHFHGLVKGRIRYVKHTPITLTKAELREKVDDRVDMRTVTKIPFGIHPTILEKLWATPRYVELRDLPVKTLHHVLSDILFLFSAGYEGGFDEEVERLRSLKKRGPKTAG